MNRGCYGFDGDDAPTGTSLQWHRRCLPPKKPARDRTSRSPQRFGIHQIETLPVKPHRASNAVRITFVLSTFVLLAQCNHLRALLDLLIVARLLHVFSEFNEIPNGPR